jgi:hypothetical protein
VVYARVDRFFLCTICIPKRGKNAKLLPNYQMAIKYTNWPYNSPNIPTFSISRPDGIILNQKSQIEYILEGLWKMLVYVVYVRFFILRPLGILCGQLVYFMVIWLIVSRFGSVIPRKIWQTLLSIRFSGIALETKRFDCVP